jgi:hypothetical protein
MFVSSIRKSVVSLERANGPERRRGHKSILSIGFDLRFERSRQQLTQFVMLIVVYGDNSVSRIQFLKHAAVQLND